MARWMIEKSGTGIEKSGTGIEKSGTGIEKSGTGIERSGSGIEKSGTGLGRRSLLALAILGLCASANALETPQPIGALQIVAGDNSVAVSWIFDGSVFSGVTTSQGSVASVYLTELSISQPIERPDARTGVIEGSDTESESDPQVVGAGSGTKVVGAGSGTEVVGAGSGTEVVGAGSGTEVVGTGSGVQVVGAGSGVAVVGSGSGSSQLVVGTGSGRESITITLPEGTGLRMEVAMGCNSATVTLLDSDSVEIAVFENQPVIGSAAATYCTDMGSGPGLRQPGFGAEPEFGSGWEMR